MDIRQFGKTGLKVTALGYGAGQIGAEHISEKQAKTILNTVLDSGINLIDTARGYGASEERIGKALSKRRQEFILSTKVGYGVDGVPDWSYDAVKRGVDEAISKMKCEWIDIVHLHSCPKETLQHGEVIRALDDAQNEGKVGVVAYSGENHDLEYAVLSERFGAIMASINVFDQKIIDWQLPRAKNRSMGVIAKRPLGNAPWRFNDFPEGDYCAEYWRRMKEMQLDFGPDWDDIALRFCAFTYGVDSCIVGTTNLKNLKKNVDNIEKGILPQEIINQIREAFVTNDKNWMGEI